MLKDRKSKKPQQPEQFSMSPNLHAVQGQERTVRGSEKEEVKEATLRVHGDGSIDLSPCLMASVQLPLPT